MHDFSFYRIVPTAIRFIGGFGAIHWIDTIAFDQENPFWGANEKRIISHMNNDHRKDLILYSSFYKNLEVSANDLIEMVGIDADGFDVLLNNRKIRFNFDSSIATASEARQMLVKMSKEAKNTVDLPGVS